MDENSQLIIEQLYLNTLMEKRLNAGLSIHGLSMTEFLIMYRLSMAAKQSLSRVRIADQVGLTASGVTRLLAPMEKIGLVAKEINPRDARQSMVSLTAAGRRLFEEVKQTIEQSAAAMLRYFDDAEREQLGLLHGKIVL